MLTTTDRLIALLKDDGTKTLKANQRASSLSQIEKIANTRFASVQDLYTYLRDERCWPFSVKADSIYRSWMKGKFSGRNWSILTPSFDDIASSQTVRVENGTTTAAILVGVARAEKSLAARISKEKPRLEEVMEFLTGFKNYEPAPPSPPMPETQVEDVIDADFVEVPETTKPALPAPSEQPTKPETTKPAKPEAPPASQPEPLNITVGEINSPQGALKAVLAAFQKTTASSNKTTLLEFREEVKIALKSVGLLQ